MELREPEMFAYEKEEIITCRFAVENFEGSFAAIEIEPHENKLALSGSKEFYDVKDENDQIIEEKREVFFDLKFHNQGSSTINFYYECNLIAQRKGCKSYRWSATEPMRITSRYSQWKCSRYIPWKRLVDPANGFIRDRTIVLEVRLSFKPFKNCEDVDETAADESSSIDEEEEGVDFGPQTIDFEVNGKVHAIRKDLLDQYPNCYLTQLSKKSGGKSPSEVVKRVKLDRDERNFEYIIGYMTNKDSLKLDDLGSLVLEDIRRDAEFYHLLELVKLCDQYIQEKPKLPRKVEIAQEMDELIELLQATQMPTLVLDLNRDFELSLDYVFKYVDNRKYKLCFILSSAWKYKSRSAIYFFDSSSRAFLRTHKKSSDREFKVTFHEFLASVDHYLMS